MEKFYDGDNLIGILYNGDCFDVLPTLPIKPMIAITSPPYNLLNGISKQRKEDYQHWYDDNLTERQYQAQQYKLIKLLIDICDSSIWYNHKIRYAWHPRNERLSGKKCYHPIDWLSDFPIWQEIIWNRRLVRPLTNRVHSQHEYIYQIGRPKIWNNMGYSSIWEIVPTRGINHPCPFPINLPKRCINLSTNEGDWVLDPYLGSGTTALAAIQTNRRFIGIERDPHYFDLACKTINNEIQKDKQLSIWR